VEDNIMGDTFTNEVDHCDKSTLLHSLRPGGTT